MLTTESINAENRVDVQRFLRVPWDLYRGDPHWVPPLYTDGALLLNRRKHPFYTHSDATFFVAVRNNRVIGRIGAMELRPYNRAHDVRHVFFTLFDCEDDQDAAAALFARVFEWGRARSLTRAVGPRGLGALDGYGILVDGFDRQQLMTMTGYNGTWYPRLIEAEGFSKEVDFVTYELERRTFIMPAAVQRAASRAAADIRVVRYRNKRALIRAARGLGETYNRAFFNNWEYYPLSRREIDFVIEQVRPLVDHRLIAFLECDETVIGFILGFPDVSAALRRARGRLNPWSVARLLLAKRRCSSVALNGAGILPEYQGRGGNALLYTEIERAIRESGFARAELPQVAETAMRMRRDLERLGAKAIKTHRVYGRAL